MGLKSACLLHLDTHSGLSVAVGLCREAKAATEAFNTVRQTRYDAFTAAFEHVAREIDPIYKVCGAGSLFWHLCLLALQLNGAPHASLAAHAMCG